MLYVPATAAVLLLLGYAAGFDGSWLYFIMPAATVMPNTFLLLLLLLTSLPIGPNWIKPGQLPIVYHDAYNITFWGIEKLHPFDSCKFRKVSLTASLCLPLDTELPPCYFLSFSDLRQTARSPLSKTKASLERGWPFHLGPTKPKNGLVLLPG
jgi:hypothetical protein